jgi:antitoxin ParD1/3/4
LSDEVAIEEVMAMEISLSESLKEFVNEQIAKGAFASASDYFGRLVLDDLKRKTKEEIDQKLLEATKSGPATPMTVQDWKELKALAELK